MTNRANKLNIKTTNKTKNEQKPPQLADPSNFIEAMTKATEKAAPLMEKFWEKHAQDAARLGFDPMHITETYADYWQKLFKDPEKLAELQVSYWTNWTILWQDSMLRMLGEKPTNPVIEPEKGDRRFRAPEWQEHAVFDFIKQSYLLTCDLMDKSLESARNMDQTKKYKLAFYNKLFSGAMAPTNFVMTNPEVLRETLSSGGQNLIKGFENLIADLERGDGELKISTTNYDAFKLGQNIATTPGSVIYENDLMQLIQYEPATENVNKRPLLIIPPWINKYYILDLREDNSFVKWAVAQGHTVFIISWVNPEKTLAQKRFEEYMSEGVIAALDEIWSVTGEPDCNVVGYCLGGTLLSITLSWLQTHGQAERVASATFLTTLIDFEHAGEMKIFMDDEQLKLMDREMAETGVLNGRQMQQTFSLLRSNDLIWSFVVNNYLMGKEPFPFDLLYWNDDSTNMPAAMHSFYLRKLYRDNLLCKPGGIFMNAGDDKTPIDVSKVKTPAYFLSTREDHIAPWRATYAGTQLLGGPKTFTLAASGHIAGVVNAPTKDKYCYWTHDETPPKHHNWLNAAKQHDGSWWPHWQEWISGYSGGDTQVPARQIKNPIEKAPGRYVRKKS